MYEYMLDLDLKTKKEQLDTKLKKINLDEQEKLLNEERDKPIENLESENARLGNQIGALESKQEALNEERNAIRTRNNAIFNELKEESKINFQNSPEIQKVNNDIITIKSQTAEQEKKLNELNLLEKVNKEKQKIEISERITKNTIDKGLPLVEQVDYLIKNEVEPRINEVSNKERLAQELNELSSSNPEAWQTFLNNYPSFRYLFQTGYKNASATQLNSLKNMFESFLKEWQPNLNLNNNNDDNSNF